MPIDAHLHLDHYPPAERAALLERAFAAGVSALVCVSTSPESCRINEELAKRYPGRIVPAYGQHPEQPPLTASDLSSLCRWIAERPHHDPFAIGEVGLPYFLRKEAEAAGSSFDQTPYLRQLARFVALAAELDRPLALHAVYEDADTTMDLLEKFGIRPGAFSLVQRRHSDDRAADSECLSHFRNPGSAVRRGNALFGPYVPA